MRALTCWCLFATVRLAGAEPAAAVDPGPTVELPPLLVEATNGHGPHWRFGTLPGYHVLSCCSDETTERYAVRMWQLHERLARFIPPDFLLRFSSPTTLIYYSKQQAESLPKELVAEIANAGSHSLTRGRVKATPNLDLRESDSYNLFSIVDDGGRFGRLFARLDDDGVETQGLSLTRDHIFSLLRARAPAPPLWFSSGLAGLYDGLARQDDTVEFLPDLWTAGAEAKAVKQDDDAPRALLPFDELMAPVAQPETPEGRRYAERWRAEAELFVRWALFSGDPRSPDALWAYARASSSGTVAEADFRSAFGMGYADARDAMSDYLRTSVSDRSSRELGPEPKPPKLAMRDATGPEIHAVMGEWDRRTLRLMRRSHPALLQFYADQARKVMLDPYRKGEHDLPLIESLGLLYHGQGDDATARAFLEEAWRAHTQRPLALATLAELRLDEVLAHPAGADNHPSASQSGAVMEVLAAADRVQPPQPEVAIDLVRLVVGCYPGEPDPLQREMLRVAAERFPEIAQIGITAAVWQARSGKLDEAVHLADFALSRVDDPALRKRLIALRNVLRSSASKGP